MSRCTFEVFPLCRSGEFTAATFERVGRACLATRAIVSRAPFGALRVLVAPAQLAEFCALVKTMDPPKYKSPTVFDNGTLVSCFATPEDELADVWTERAARVRDAQARAEAEGT